MKYVILICLLLVTSANSAYAQSVDLKKQGREFTQTFLDGEWVSLWDQMSAKLQRKLGSKQKMSMFNRMITSRMKGELEDKGETLESNSGKHLYQRRIAFGPKMPVLKFSIQFDNQGQLTAFDVIPEK